MHFHHLTSSLFLTLGISSLSLASPIPAYVPGLNGGESCPLHKVCLARAYIEYSTANALYYNPPGQDGAAQPETAKSVPVKPGGMERMSNVWPMYSHIDPQKIVPTYRINCQVKNNLKNGDIST